MCDSQLTGGRTERRQVLRALGARTVLVGLGTTASAGQEGPPAELISGDGIHPVFGFSALEADVEAPVGVDHTVEALIRPREGGEIPEFYFEPTGLAIEPGDTVRFDLTTPHRSVTAYHPAPGMTQRVPDGVPPFSSPVLAGGAYWLYTFEEEGVYDFHCGPHEAFGHVGRIVAGSATGPGATPVADVEPGELRGPIFTAATVLDDPALDPDCVLDRGRVSWDEIAPESKLPQLS
ncbi:cupredoxin domain-containing protein [Halalkalicoccus tibetensis]|uniref:Plastocyanin/azurin family copper-binding protein n=1 Tax=Halalkalicoccus tibetensis TaxID=175632 RepID=A0ABD5V5B0_9EURY